ncbi:MULTISPECIES: hypothetical protein [unclassified Ruminococcus]|uniref:hypothetical protein n=1 Tax=unclassified Ruminococcus TaxID=2608920 RepID=UPI00319D95BA
MQKFVHLYSLGFVNRDGSINKKNMSNDAKLQAAAISSLLEEQMADVNLITYQLKMLFFAWVYDNGGGFSKFLEKSCEMLGVPGYDHFSKIESVLEKKLYNDFVAEFLVELVLILAELFHEISMEDIFMKIMMKGVPYE